MIGKWVLLDIETSGVDPSQDQIIDLGFVVFEEGQRLKECSFRIKTDQVLDPVIIALTGLSVPELQEDGKTWEEIRPELEILQGSVLIAHNASFEESFLKSLFEKLEILPHCADNGSYFHDSLDILPFLLPFFPRLGLESINQIFNLWPKEKHQGLADSQDLADALIYSNLRTSMEEKQQIIKLNHLSSWWKKWLLFEFQQADCKTPIAYKFSDREVPKLVAWNQENLTAFADNYSEATQKWMSLKLIQMMGRGISGIVAISKTSPLDLDIINDVAINFCKSFKQKKVVLCTSFFSPDEKFWFKNDSNTISIEQLSCEIFRKHAVEMSEVLNLDEQGWSRELMRFYATQKVSWGVASRVPDLWCRKEPVVDVLWRSCRYLAKKKLKEILQKEVVEKLVVLQPVDLDIVAENSEVTTVFWQAKQLEWNTEFNVEKIKFFDYEHVLIICKILERLDSENLPLVTDAKKLFEEFNKVITNYIDGQQDTDQKRVFWDVDFSELSRRFLTAWKVQALNFLARRKNLKKYQTELLDALWSQLDQLMEHMLQACTTHSFGLSWKASSEKKVWELWNWQVSKTTVSGARIFIDYEFDEESKEYWNDVFGLNPIEKSKRFDKVQLFPETSQFRKFGVNIWEDVLPAKLLSQIKELSQRGRVLICSHDQAASTNIYSALVKEKFCTMATWSELLRHNLDPVPNIVFCWEKDFRLIPTANHLWLNFDYMIIDRIPDLAWFAWAQAAWKMRVKNFATSSFEAYWCRRAGILREKFWPMASLCNVKEVMIFDSRKNKWKGDSWRIISSYIS